MSQVYLTIDDGPTAQTPELMDYLISKQITPVLFFRGDQIESYYKEAVDAVRRGAIVGNLSYSYPRFSQITLEEAMLEILKTEMLLNQVYQDAGVTRKYKIFRFPYGDKGGANREKLQRFLCAIGLHRFNDYLITNEAYIKAGNDKDIDVYWTYEISNDRLKNVEESELLSILNEIEQGRRDEQYGLLDPDIYNILLMHDNMEVGNQIPEYYSVIIDYLLANDVRFEEPRFLDSNFFDCDAR